MNADVRIVELVNGRGFAIVDAEDYERVACLRWVLGRRRHTNYAWARLPSGRVMFPHRFVMGTPDGMQTDHKNHDGLDCRKSNLRQATQSQNVQNARKRRTPATSRFKGVSYSGDAKRRKPWMAAIHLDGVTHYLGRHSTEEEAAIAYDEKARELFGEFAVLNFG